MKTISKRAGESKLQAAVRLSVNRHADGDVCGFLLDVLHGGCQSGVVGELIYYTDTVRFYKRHAREIDAMLSDLCADCGTTPAGLFGDKWDASDPMARDVYNQNLLAWFGYESVCDQLVEMCP